ncbi:MAG: AMP-binding protein, partial [Ruminococcus sp.]
MEYTYDIAMFKETFETEFTWLNGFMRNVNRFSDNIALVEPLKDKSWTYSELNTECNKLANAILSSGAKKSDVVFYQLYNSPHFVFCHIAAQKAGCISNPANFNLSPGETAEIINHNKPKVYVYDSSIVKTAVKALEMSEHKPDVVIMVDFFGNNDNVPKGHILYEDFVKGASEDNPKLSFKPHIYDEVLRLQTSGTTGTPKGVPLNNINEVL